MPFGTFSRLFVLFSIAVLPLSVATAAEPALEIRLGDQIAYSMCNYDA